MQRVFLQITVGKKDEYECELEKFNNAKRLLEKIHLSYGLPADIGQLSADELEILQENSKKELRFTEPESIDKGRIVIELFPDTPKTATNFLKICTGEVTSKTARKPLHYKNTLVHRIVKDYIIQGGDVTRGDGSGGESIYGGKFNDEKPGLNRKFVKGSVGMANSGKNSNSSQFFFSMNDFHKLNGKYVCFGQVVEGLEILDLINDTVEPVIVSDCGVIE
ncbi:hypothetical protein HK103_001544 [Boothiomyces macroporosus]|uniref:Peptidyl-prolyl cis-trans isomerase n=1 Tax=Boothiomyces macroporosus TaxID=261099 RepID=A0AAD5UB87_9FUNG|nr:hypothetical protein HK103_001544 [Boothiomyces macroporosus]